MLAQSQVLCQVLGIPRWVKAHQRLPGTRLCQSVVCLTCHTEATQDTIRIGEDESFYKNSTLSIRCQGQEDDSVCPLTLLRNNKICLPFYLNQNKPLPTTVIQRAKLKPN